MTWICAKKRRHFCIVLWCCFTHTLAHTLISSCVLLFHMPQDDYCASHRVCSRADDVEGLASSDSELFCKTWALIYWAHQVRQKGCYLLSGNENVKTYYSFRVTCSETHSSPKPQRSTVAKVIRWAPCNSVTLMQRGIHQNQDDDDCCGLACKPPHFCLNGSSNKEGVSIHMEYIVLQE